MATNTQIPNIPDNSAAPELASGLDLANAMPQGQVFNRDVLKENEELQKVAAELGKHFIGLDKWVRRQEVIETRRQRFYWRNDQYIYWKSDSVGFIQAAGGQSITSGNTSAEIPRYTDVYNIYTPYGESILSTLIQNPPGVNWQPVDPSKAEDITGSQAAEKYQQKIERDNDRKALQSEIARLFYTDGRTTLYTRRVENEEDGTSRQVITAHGVLETKAVPITARNRDDLVAYFVSDEIDVWKAKDEYKDYAEKIKEGSTSLGESAYERIARLGVLQGTKLLMQAGDAFAHMVTRHTIFLRPSTFNKAPEEYREQLHQLFPSGLKATFCGEAYCGSENASMDDQLSIGFPTPGDGMSRPSIGKRMVPLQDTFNDELNLWHEAHDHCVPTTFVYSETGDLEAIRDLVAEPGSFVPFTALPPGANNAQAAFYEAVLDAIPATLPQLLTFIQGPLAQFICGAFPALFGGDTGDNDTAKGIAIQRDQAMGRMGIAWGSLQELMAESYRQTVQGAVEFDNENDMFSYSTIDRTGNTLSESIPISDLKRGSFKCVPDTDSSFPETTNAKKATFQTMMAAAERNPIIADVMSQPKNQELGHEWMGLPELTVPGASSGLKQLVEISELLKEGPVPPSDEELLQLASQNPQLAQVMAQWEQQAAVAVQSGQPTPPKPIPPELMNPSIPVDHFDFHNYELEECKNWLSSEERRREQLRGNLPGIENVKVHARKHEEEIQKQMMQQMAMSQPQPPGTKPGGQPAKAAHIIAQHKPNPTAEPEKQAQTAPKVM